jgi:CheY-like chemotaxis protein
LAKILVVDDSSFARMRVSHMLQEGGHETVEAADGREGMAMAQQELPDCILTDLLMPEMDGVSLLAALHEHGINLPVIVLTADIQESKRRQCEELGAAGFLPKPPQSTVLLALVEKVLTGRGGKGC